MQMGNNSKQQCCKQEQEFELWRRYNAIDLWLVARTFFMDLLRLVFLALKFDFVNLSLATNKATGPQNGFTSCGMVMTDLLFRHLCPGLTLMRCTANFDI